MITQADFWTGAGAALLVAALAGLAEWRRGRRRNLDVPGWMPWTGVQIVAIFAALLCAILAVKAS